MARVFIPPLLRPHAGGAHAVEVQATNVREALDALDARFPGLSAHLRDGERLKPGLNVVVDGDVSPSGLLQKLNEEAEVHFLPAIGGG